MASTVIMPAPTMLSAMPGLGSEQIGKAVSSEMLETREAVGA